MTGPPSHPTGLQAPRTSLAWSRTAFGVTANAVLLSVRELDGTRPVLAALPIALAALLAAATILYARHRDATLRRRPLPRPLASRRPPVALGVAVIALALVTGLTLFLP